MLNHTNTVILDPRFGVRRAEAVLTRQLVSLWAECARAGCRPLEALARHACMFCDCETDRYLCALVDDVVLGTEARSPPAGCVITSVRTIALLGNLCEHSGHTSDSLRSQLAEFDAMFPGTRSLEWEFIAEDGLRERFNASG
jgi:hypothetical protein